MQGAAASPVTQCHPSDKGTGAAVSVARSCGYTPLSFQTKGVGDMVFKQCLQREKFSLKVMFFCTSPLYIGAKNGMWPFGKDRLKQSISPTKHLVTPSCNLQTHSSEGTVTSAVVKGSALRKCAERACGWDPGSPGIPA